MTGDLQFPLWLTIAAFVVDVVASLHVILHKRDVRAAIGWVGLIWLVPVAGAALYALFGINRVRRRAREIRRARPRTISETAEHVASMAMVARNHPNLTGLSMLVEKLSGRALLGGNAVEPLINGDAAYPEMLAAIDGATQSIALSTFIFAPDAAGRRFIDALARAVQRGVVVRVLLDAAGVRYNFPPAHWALRKAGVPVARFLPTIVQAGPAFFNLRNHRKLLIVDGQLAFAGGMNIHARCLSVTPPRRGVREVHFRVEGPVVAQLTDVFVDDWRFVTGEALEGPRWYAELTQVGSTSARVITDGPDGDLDVLRAVILGAITSARESVRIVTPYFLPDPPMIAALGVAALRGVEVDIVLPSRVNIPIAQWASTALLWQVLKPGCRVFLSPLPFDHSKLFVIDRSWALIGSSNWDPRSLRLNFELDIECHDAAFATRIDDMVSERIALSRSYSLAEADGRSFAVRVRDGTARLLTPYL